MPHTDLRNSPADSPKALYDLEYRLIHNLNMGRRTGVEAALIILSGIHNHADVVGYHDRIDQVQANFDRFLGAAARYTEPHHVALQLSGYLWATMPKAQRANHTLTEVANAVLDDNQGNSEMYNPNQLDDFEGSIGFRQMYLVIAKRVFDRIDEEREARGIDDRVYNELIGTKYFPFVYVDERFLYKTVLKARAVKKMESKDYEGAVVDLGKAIALDEEFVPAYWARAKVQLKQWNIRGWLSDLASCARIKMEQFIDDYQASDGRY